MDQNRIIEQLRLSMSILSGRRGQQTPLPSGLTAEERDLLAVEEGVSYSDMLLAAEEVVSEIVLAALGLAEDRRTPPPDPRMIAALLLREIEQEGGELPITRLHLPPDFLNELWKEGIISRRGGHVVWGKNAERALKDAEEVFQEDGHAESH